MLLPRLTNCPECASIPSLLANIDCKLNQLASALYNNTIFALNQPISAVTMLDLLNYKRILAYRICNPDYAGLYTLNMIASRVIILTGNCKTKCGGASKQAPATTTTSTSAVPTTTTSTTCIPRTTTTTTSSSSTSTSTTTATPTTTTTTTAAVPTTTTTTTHSPTTTTTTSGGLTTTTTSSTSTTTTSSSSTTTTTTTSGEPTTTTTTTIAPIIDTYGYLYNWWAATDVRNIANTDWHLPSEEEMINLRLFFDPVGSTGSNTAGGPMKATGFTYWFAPNTGATNISNLDFRGSGERSSAGVFSQLNGSATYWNSDDTGSSTGGVGRLLSNYESFFTGVGFGGSKRTGFSLRLKKDTPTVGANYTIISGGYTGNNGDVYNTVIIDGYEWLGSNLKETNYRNGNTITMLQDSTLWESAGIAATEAMCYYVI